MSASGVNVLRYSALGLGVFYGFTHQRTITATQKAEAAKREYAHKKHLIDEAKKAYQKSKDPNAANKTGGLNQDPMSPNFNLESFFEALMQQK